MRFAVDEVIAAPPHAVFEALLDPAWYDAAAVLDKLGAPEVLSIEREGDRATTHVRYRFTAPLSPAVTAVVDPARLSWVQVTTYALAARRARFELRPDHYADRLRAAGTIEVDATPTGARRSVAGDLKVRMPLVGGQVERAIVSGLREHLAAEALLLGRWIAERS